MLARKEGIFAEPASVTPIPALKKLVDEGKIDRGGSVVCSITGTWLKDTNIVTSLHKKTPLVSPSLDHLGKILKAG